MNPHQTGPDPVDLYVGSRLRVRRKQLNVTQEALARALGITFQQVQKYEKGANRVSASMLVRASAALNVPPGWFFEGLQGVPGGSTLALGESTALNNFVSSPYGMRLVHSHPSLPARIQKRITELCEDLAGIGPTPTVSFERPGE